MTGRTLQYIDVDYLDSTGALISQNKYITLSKRKTAQKHWRNPHELVCLGASRPSSPRTFDGFSQEHRTSKNAHALLHELRCFFDASYRLHQVRMATKAQMRTLDLGCVQLFEKYDLDGSGCIDREELGKAIRDSLHLNIRETEVDVIMSEIDKDGGGDVDVDEFSAWLFAPSSEPWLDKKRRYQKDDPCHDLLLLRRDIARFDPMVRKLLEGFWQVCDRDGSGSIDLEEYLFLHLNLYAAMNTDATQKEGWQDEARVVATREWDFDRQGQETLNRDRFFTSFYQIVDAWLVGEPTTEAYVKFLCFLLDRITVQDDDPDDGGRRQVKLRWEADPLWLETLEPLADVLPEDNLDASLPDMERRLARGADKCIHAVPGLLEAVSGAGLDALLSTRPCGDVEVDLGEVFPSDEASVAASEDSVQQAVKEAVQEAFAARVSSSSSSSSDSEPEPEPEPVVYEEPPVMTEEDNRLMEELEKRRRKNEEARRRKEFLADEQKKMEAKLEKKRLKEEAKAERKRLKAEAKAQAKARKQAEREARKQASAAEVPVEAEPSWEEKLAQEEARQLQDAKEAKKRAKQEALERKRLKQRQRDMEKRKRLLEAEERRLRREEAAAAKIAEAQKSGDAARARNIQEELARANRAFSEEEARIKRQQEEEDASDELKAKLAAKEEKRRRKAEARALEEEALRAAKAERKRARELARLQQEVEIGSVQESSDDEEAAAWRRARKEDARRRRHEAKEAKRLAKLEKRRAKELEKAFEGDQLKAAAQAREERRLQQDVERRERAEQERLRRNEERSRRRQERLKEAQRLIDEAERAGDAAKAEMIHAELQREERASREKELEEDAREERQDLKDHSIRLRMTEREWRQQCREEEAAERLAEREAAAAERRRERERLETIAREERAKLAEAALARCEDASEIQRIRLELAKADQEAKEELVKKNLEAQQELERQTRLTREKIEEEAALARQELREAREEERRAEHENYAKRRLEREAQAAARIEEARLAGDQKAAEQIAKELAAANRRSREQLEAANRAAAEAQTREEAAEQRLLRRAARAEARRLKEREAAMKRKLKYDEASKRRQQREAEDDALAEKMRKKQDEAEARRKLREEEAAAKIAEAKRLGDEKEALRIAALKEEADRVEAEKLALEEEQLRMKREALAEASRASREEPSVSLSRDSISLTDSSSSSSESSSESDSSDGEEAPTTSKDAMFGLLRAKGAVHRRVTKNRKLGDAIGRAGASVFGAPPKVETKAEMYRKRAQEERANVERWTPVAEPPKEPVPPAREVVQTYIPPEPVVAPRVDVDWAAEVAKARDDAGSEEACRKSVATSDGDLGVSKHQQRRHQLTRRYASQRSRRPSDARAPRAQTLTLANDPVMQRDPYTQQDLPSSTLAQPDFSWETRYGLHEEEPNWAQALRSALDKAREPRSISHLRSVFLPEKGLSSGGCSVYSMPLHIRSEGAVDDQPSLQSASSTLREPEPTRAASPSSLATQRPIKLPDLPSPGGTAEGPPMQRPRTPASALAVERARARQTFRGKPERPKREPRRALHTPKAKKPSHRMWSSDDPRFCEGSRQPDWALRLPSAGRMDACFLDSGMGLLEASSTIARPATAARALSDFEKLPVPDDNGFFPASPQSRGSPMSRGSRRFPSPGQSLQARQFFPPTTLG